MGPSSKPDHHLNLNYLPQSSATQPHSGPSTADTSPIEPSAGNNVRSPYGASGGVNGLPNTSGGARLGTGSPSHDIGGRLYSKRAREIQAQEGVNSNPWGPPASGGSTPLRETIPESPSQDGFPDFMPPSESLTSPQRRTRAGTLPSRFSSPGGTTPNPIGSQTSQSKSSRPTPSTSPFRPSLIGTPDKPSNSQGESTSALLSRLRAGSMPQRASYLGSSNPYSSAFFSPGWGSGRERSSTLTSIRSGDELDSNSRSFTKEGLSDSDVKTLDYLGLIDPPQQNQTAFTQAAMQNMSESQRAATMQPLLANIMNSNQNLINRFRSYSVNAKEKYASDEEDAWTSGQRSGSLTPSAASAAAALAETQEQIRIHNLAVQAYASHPSVNRPRARTAGNLDSPLRSAGGRAYFATPSRLDKSVTAADLNNSEHLDYEGLQGAVRAMQLNNLAAASGLQVSDENNLEGPTRALWLGNIPTSTTSSSLQAIFGIYGKIDSARVLSHKNCGFVNYENIESAIQAKSLLNGKEIFPGAGAIRIGYAKAPSTDSPSSGSRAFTPTSQAYEKPSSTEITSVGTSGFTNNYHGTGAHPDSATLALHVNELGALRNEILHIVRDFGATDQDSTQIANSVDAAISFRSFEHEIPPVPEPSHTREHDAPKLREIRKRIDNGSISQVEIEETTMNMLPEIAELASDYLGNTVVQKLFEFCSEGVKEQMLMHISPHMAEIGIHKNGTWAAQKIIETAKTPNQIAMIVNNLRPHTVALFLDQYGNYVLQCCLRFGYPWNNFIFETMLSRMWDIAQGRFGARAMRACLESHHSTRDQQRMLAAAIALHSVQLATNQNAALLLTWFLDTCTFPRRRTVLAPRLLPHLVHLCTHKVAYLTVLKVINQRNEPEARDMVLQALFHSPNDQVLEDILSDQSCGATLIFKILTTPFFDDARRSDIAQNVRTVLCRIKASPSQGYKRLMDEVGLSTRHGKADRENQPNGVHSDHSRPISQQGAVNSQMQQQNMARQYSGHQLPALNNQQQQYTVPVTQSMDSNSSRMPFESRVPFEHYGLNNISNSLLAQSPSVPHHQHPQLQYQQAFLAAQARNMSPASNFFPTSMATGYGAPSSSIDSFRTMQSSPMGPMSPNPPQAGYTVQPQGFNSVLNSPGMVPGFQFGMGYYPQQQQPQQQMHGMQQGGGRRGRR